ncbi:unnamed protein product, partial [marine sediment metagenome]
LLGKFQAQATAELLGKFQAQATADLLSKFEAQASADLLSRFGVNQDAEDLLGKFKAQAIANLLGKFDAQIIQDLLARFQVSQDSRELLGKTVIRHDGAPVDLPARFEAQVILDLLARVEVGQDSAELLGNAVIRGLSSAELLDNAVIRGLSSAELFGRFEAQVILDLLARVEVGQDSVDLLSKAVIIHPTYPLWLYAKFSVELTYLDLGSILKLRHSTYSECVGRAAVRHTGAPAELSGVCFVPYLAVAELPGEGTIRDVGSAELPCSFST